LTTILLIALNVAAFVALKAAGLVDASWPDSCVAFAGVHGGCPGALTAHPWSIVSYLFIHINVLHLTVNMLWLLAFGTMLEKTAGRGASFLLSPPAQWPEPWCLPSPLRAADIS